jgi:hypothetical protein
MGDPCAEAIAGDPAYPDPLRLSMNEMIRLGRPIGPFLQFKAGIPSDGFGSIRGCW